MKTNAVRLLEASGTSFALHSYAATDGRIDAASVAEKLDIETDRLFKTLVTRGSSGEILVFCIPGTTELDLRKAAAAAAEKSVEMVHAAELKPLTGYERGGCSPIGMKRSFPLWIEESALAFDRVLVSAGAIGLQIELSPDDLVQLTGGQVGDLV